MKRYLILDVGCLECCEPVTIRGWTDTPPLDSIIVIANPAEDAYLDYGYLVAIDTQGIPDA
jgi:hypothetical protein